LGGGQKQANAAVEVPAIQWLYFHPNVLSCFRQALGTDSIMFTSHADVQKDILGGWHKDDGTDAAAPDMTGYFSKFAYGIDDCKVYKMGIYLQDHQNDAAGLSVREGSHRTKSWSEGPVRYTGGPAGSVVVFDVRITHTGQLRTRLQRKLIDLASYLPKQYFEPAFAKARRSYRAAVGRERIAMFFTFGMPNEHTIEFATSNMRRQLKLEPGTNPKLPPNVRQAFESNHVLLAEDHFPKF
jgi:hypothetical protein